jgi:hypothetical protein
MALLRISCVNSVLLWPLSARLTCLVEQPQSAAILVITPCIGTITVRSLNRLILKNLVGGEARARTSQSMKRNTSKLLRNTHIRHTLLHRLRWGRECVPRFTSKYMEKKNQSRSGIVGNLHRKNYKKRPIALPRRPASTRHTIVVSVYWNTRLCRQPARPWWERYRRWL